MGMGRWTGAGREGRRMIPYAGTLNARNGYLRLTAWTAVQPGSRAMAARMVTG